MVKCPHCGRPAMSLGRKAGLGPGRIISCQSCAKPVTTHSMAVFAAIPAFLGGFAALRSGSLLFGTLSVVGGVLVMALIQTFLVPLTKSDA
jgi:hypothetical protein